mmetsp:Transcript_109256/g.308208  ORF Transcript_109256/g.308208 Transcript_109256/m.308208 type:complete len:335 (+) Transcript_109256:442-1446(+)
MPLDGPDHATPIYHAHFKPLLLVRSCDLFHIRGLGLQIPKDRKVEHIVERAEAVGTDLKAHFHGLVPQDQRKCFGHLEGAMPSAGDQGSRNWLGLGHRGKTDACSDAGRRLLWALAFPAASASAPTSAGNQASRIWLGLGSCGRTDASRRLLWAPASAVATASAAASAPRPLAFAVPFRSSTPAFLAAPAPASPATPAAASLLTAPAAAWLFGPGAPALALLACPSARSWRLLGGHLFAFASFGPPALAPAPALLAFPSMKGGRLLGSSFFVFASDAPATKAFLLSRFLPAFAPALPAAKPFFLFCLPGRRRRPSLLLFPRSFRFTRNTSALHR